MSKEVMKLAMSWIHANGEHDQLCDILDLDDYGKHKPCSCGLSRVQSALRKALAEQPAQQALDKMAKNARDIGLDYEPSSGAQVSKVWRDGGKLVAKQVPLEDFYKPAQHRAWFTVDELSAWADKKLKENPQWADQPAQVDPCIDGSCSCCWAQLDEQPAQQTDSYVQQVPDKCDRIVWRGSYYHLPLQPAQQEPVVFYRCNGCGHAYEQVHPTSCDCMEDGGFDRVEYYTSPPAQQGQVAWTLLLTGEHHGLVGKAGEKFVGHSEHYKRVDVYTSPRRTWVGLTFGQFHKILQNHKDIGSAMGAVEKMLREQNT